MRVRLLLPYYPDGDIANDRNDISDEEYANQLLKNFGGNYSRYMDNVINSMDDSRYDVMDIMPEKYQIKGVKDKSNVEYYSFECELNNEEDRHMSEDEFNFYANSGDICAFFVHMVIKKEDDWYSKNDDAISELNFWLKDSMNIMRDPHIDDDHKVGMLPDKDLIIELVGVNNPMFSSKYCLSGSRVIDQDNANNFAIIVNKIKNV